VFKILTIAFATTIKGTVDQVDTNQVITELVAKDGHIHEAELPIWIFPCKVEEGTIFWIKTFEDSVTITCKKEKK
tara:strand:- start:141 stop:365 length:225 start_codon:yes stop_codon:yes gene_type:complete